MPSDFDTIMENARRYAESQAAPIPQSAEQRAFLEAARVYQNIMNAEGQKTATIRALETAQTRQAALATEYEFLARDYSQNAERLAQIEPELRQLQTEIATHENLIERQRLAAAPPPPARELSFIEKSVLATQEATKDQSSGWSNVQIDPVINL